MNNKLETSLDEISLELLAVDLDNPDAECRELMRLIQGFLDQAGTNPQHTPMCSAGQVLMLKQDNLSVADFVKELGAFVSQAQNFIRTGDTALFESKGQATPGTAPTVEIADTLDREFLVEFIEKHTGMLDEFEAAILEFRLNSENQLPGTAETAEDVRAFQRFTKGYIHNIKGDAGSIGMTGVEKTCHFVEDLLGEHTPDTILEQLLSFREWLSGYLKDVAAGNPISENSESFRARFVEMLNGSAQPDSATVSAGRQDIPAGANLDLLAELMADDSFKELLVADKSLENAAVPPPSPVPPKTQSAQGSQQVAYQLTGDQEVFQEFVVEAEEHLEMIESTLLDSGGNYSSDAIDGMFRGIHSIKGASSFYGLKEVTESSHLTENLLDEVRQGKRPFDRGLTELCLQYIDLEKNLLRNARAALTAGGTLYTTTQAADYIRKLKTYQAGNTAQPGTIPQVIPDRPIEVSTPDQKMPPTQLPGKPAVSAIPVAPPESSKTSNEQLEVKNYVKVETQRLDLLIDSIGEMCIYSSVLIQRCRELISQDEEVSKMSHQVEKFSRDLQNIGMSMRLIPIRGLFQKMSRLVWDTARKMSKDVKFQMEGEDTELDRTIIDKLADPLMHMIRNAMDHGVEPAEERVKVGKPKTGSINLSAEHSAGSIHIKIKDDGRGLDPEKLLKKAREKGIIAEGQQLSRQEIFSLIFAPGFSTAAVVTDISGRGVGMDVVKRNIESLRGRVRIASEIGKGTEFTIELPLTLALIDGIQVAVGAQSYIIPKLSVVEFIKPAPEMITRTLDRGETFHFRGRFLPVFSLAKLFQIPSDCTDRCDGTLIIAESAGEQFALAVDRIVGTISTVIKNLGEMFEQRRGIAGCAVMANGNVALILDVGSLLQVSRVEYKFEMAALAASGKCHESAVPVDRQPQSGSEA